MENLSTMVLLVNFEQACFNLVNYPKNKRMLREFRKLEREIGLRLGLTEEEAEYLPGC